MQFYAKYRKLPKYRILHGTKTKKVETAIIFYLFEQINEIIYYIFWGQKGIVKGAWSLKLDKLRFNPSSET